MGIGKGAITGDIALSPVGNEVDTEAEVKAEHVNVSHLLAAAGLGSGEGILDGTAKLKGRGASMSSILANGDGALRIVMPMGGNINALLVDLSGVEIVPAFLAAIGVPDKEGIRCMVADFELRHGILASRVLEVNTTEHVITGGGRVDLSREIVEMSLRTDPKHFTIGKLATPILISGPLKHLRFMPDKELVIRFRENAAHDFERPRQAFTCCTSISDQAANPLLMDFSRPAQVNEALDPQLDEQISEVEGVEEIGIDEDDRRCERAGIRGHVP